MTFSWFLTSRWGQTILLALGMSLAAGFAWWLADHRGYERGYAECQDQHAAAIARANENQAKAEARQRQAATEIAKASDQAVERATVAADTATATTKEVIRNVYHEVLVPVTGSCAPRALDSRVQERIDKAVDSANGS